MDDTCRIQYLTIEEDTVVCPLPEAEHERAIAIADLLNDNHFYPCAKDNIDAPLFPGPYSLHLRLKDNRLHFDISTPGIHAPHTLMVPVTPFRSVIRDYFMICGSYYKAVREGNTAQVEAIDMGRRGLHNEGSELLQELLHTKARVNFETARRLFTLICALHLRQHSTAV